jgi:hypothetical protein
VHTMSSRDVQRCIRFDSMELYSMSCWYFWSSRIIIMHLMSRRYIQTHNRWNSSYRLYSMPRRYDE